MNRLLGKALWTFGVALLVLASCKFNKQSSTLASDGYPDCTPRAIDPDNDGWGWENNRSCRVIPYCSGNNPDSDRDAWGNKKRCRVAPSCGSASSDPDGDGWGWENSQSCRVEGRLGSSQPKATQSSGNFQQYETTYYPYRGEHYFRTVCGAGGDHGGMYFAVTERSPLWEGSCDNESWAVCQDSDCLGKWDRMPADVKKWENGQKMVREPRCNIPCGRRFAISSVDRRYQTTAVIYDACPSQHWNNRFKEFTEGRNPCAQGALHVDLRKPLYLYLNGGQENDNIKVLINSNPLP